MIAFGNFDVLEQTRITIQAETGPPTHTTASPGLFLVKTLTARSKIVRGRARRWISRVATTRLTSTIFLLVATVLLPACKPQSESKPQWRTQRSLDPVESLQPLDEQRLAHINTVDSWDFSDTGEHEQWTVKVEKATRKTAAGTTHRIMLISRVDIDAGRVDQVAISFKGDSKAVPVFFWAAPGQRFAETRRIEGRSVDSADEQELEFVFPVTESPDWHGPVERVRIDLTVLQTESIAVREIRFLKLEFDQSKLGEATKQSWRITRKSEQRVGRLGVPGFPISVPVDRSETEQQIRFRVAVGDHARGGTTFRVSERSSGRVLFERDVEPLETGWSDEFAVDLPPSPQADTELQLTTVAPDLQGPTAGLPAWGSLHIVERDDREPPMNVVFICIDTLRADHLATYGYHRQTSPEIDRWAERLGVVFSTTVAPAPWTLPSHIAFLSGFDALHHGSNYDRAAPDGMTFLAEFLHREGYLTAAITGGAYLNPKFGLDQGFDEYRSWTGPKEEEIAVHGPLAANWIKSNRVEPFFFFFHTYEVHGPFLEHEPFYSRFAEPRAPSEPELAIATRTLPRRAEDGFIVRREFTQRETGTREWKALGPGRDRDAIDRYDAGIASADTYIGALLNEIYSSDFADRTIVILVSDHGEALGERGLAGHAYLDDFNLLVPLIIAVPSEGWSTGRINQQVRLVDIVPTILDLVGIDIPAELDGESLQPLVIARGEPQQRDRPGRDAWSYAASSNYGIGLRDTTLGQRYEFNNTAWGSAQGHETIEGIRIGDASPNAPANEVPPATVQRLRDKVVNRAESIMPGAWIHLSSHFDSTFVVNLESSTLVDPSHLKCLACPTGLSWILPGFVSITVQPGEEYLLNGEIGASTTLDLSVEPGFNEPGIALNLALAEMDQPVELTLDHRGWHEPNDESDPGRSRANIRVWRRGAPYLGGEDAPVDRDLTQQLRALGYVVD